MYKNAIPTSFDRQQTNKLPFTSFYFLLLPFTYLEDQEGMMR
jgi:hypothetical protein